MRHGAHARRLAEVIDLPVFVDTTCRRCGADDGLAIRHGDGALCVDCYREVRSHGRRADRPLECLVRRAATVRHRAGRAVPTPAA